MIKRLVTAAVALGLALGASAEFRWGPTVGINGSTLKWKQDLVSTSHLIGYQVGLTGEVMIPGIGFGVGVGLNYQMNGSKVNFGERIVWSSQGIGETSLKMHTLQFPLNLRFKWTRMEGFEHYLAPFAFAGPVFSFNLAATNGKMIEFPAGTIDLQVGAGAEILERVQVFGGYYWGVSYQARTILLDNFSARPEGWFVGVTYLF